ncbi:hypothetical protein FJT64_003655 [Amphibalanus amphitrite]|uniref:Uncharacterized protein n=1 Tax=Amphibalanus amphitrite TaxID=1232801 RepID=A0A6A4VZM2_AMPAM|nr:hypothetical protein FJT64_003655 [Amphibalanus amphitrite]
MCSQAPSQPVYAQPAPSKARVRASQHIRSQYILSQPLLSSTTASDGCKTDYQCPKGSYCFSYNCVQCITDEHCSAGGRHSRTYQRRCEHNRCVDIWQDDVVKCTKYSACPDGQYCSAGKCTPFVPEWMPCSVAESCQSNSCLQGKCAECSQWKPCAAGQFCDHGHCKSPGKTGDSCWLSFQCKSHICWQGLCADCAHHSDCKNAGEFCDKGRCKSLLRYGYKCSENSQCVSRICDSKTQQCVDCVNSLGCPDNSFCSADLKCVRKGMFRDVCTSDNQCLSNKCGPKNRCVQCSRVQDCDSTTHFCDLVDGACTPLGRAGQICSTTEQCLPSLTCSPVTNKCVQCLFNTDCLSGQRCDNTLGMCVAKSVLALGGCTLGQFCSLEGACLTANVPLNGACLSGQNEQCAAGLVCTNRVCTSPSTAINPDGCIISSPESLGKCLTNLLETGRDMIKRKYEPVHLKNMSQVNKSSVDWPYARLETLLDLQFKNKKWTVIPRDTSIAVSLPDIEVEVRLDGPAGSARPVSGIAVQGVR